MSGLFTSLLCILAVCVLCFLCGKCGKPINIEKAELRYVGDDTIINEDPKKKLEIISCECNELENTSHSESVAHKLSCPVFRQKNQGLTVKQFLTQEGFLIDVDQDWPPLEK